MSPCRPDAERVQCACARAVVGDGQGIRRAADTGAWLRHLPHHPHPHDTRDRRGVVERPAVSLLRAIDTEKPSLLRPTADCVWRL